MPFAGRGGWLGDAVRSGWGGVFTAASDEIRTSNSAAIYFKCVGERVVKKRIIVRKLKTLLEIEGKTTQLIVMKIKISQLLSEKLGCKSSDCCIL